MAAGEGRGSGEKTDSIRSDSGARDELSVGTTVNWLSKVVDQTSWEIAWQLSAV